MMVVLSVMMVGLQAQLRTRIWQNVQGVGAKQRDQALKVGNRYCKESDW